MFGTGYLTKLLMDSKKVSRENKDADHLLYVLLDENRTQYEWSPN